MHHPVQTPLSPIDASRDREGGTDQAAISHQLLPPLSALMTALQNAAVKRPSLAHHPQEESQSSQMDKEMERLELLSLVNRVSQEIFNFTGNQDKTLAEFVISVRRDSDENSLVY